MKVIDRIIRSKSAVKEFYIVDIDEDDDESNNFDNENHRQNQQKHNRA